MFAQREPGAPGSPGIGGDPSVAALVARAAEFDQAAWNELVERYAPMIWAICSRYRLSRQDIEDVSQSVWLLLVEHLGTLREPAAVRAWLATTTSRECLRALRVTRRYDSSGSLPEEPGPGPGEVLIEEEIIVAERNAALRAAFGDLPHPCRQLLAMLISDPPHSYREISTILNIPPGSIGPRRARCLARLRRSSSVRAVFDPSFDNSGGEPGA